MQGNITPKLIIHGGAGKLEGNLDPKGDGGKDGAKKRREERHEAFRLALKEIAGEGYGILSASDARQAVLHSVRLLEENPLFNAGTGSRLQADGVVRMSAGLMDGPGNRFSGVINIQNVRNPIDLADLLAGEKHRILTGDKAQAFARDRNLAHHNPITSERQEEYERKVQGKSGTVGAVALDSEGRIFVGTSTGGIGGETPGRASDSPTVAGTYASPMAGVSCTGIGEDIINQAAAARVVIRVTDGMSLEEAVAKTFQEADQHGYSFGLIAIDRGGMMEIGSTREVDIFFATHGGKHNDGNMT